MSILIIYNCLIATSTSSIDVIHPYWTFDTAIHSYIPVLFYFYFVTQVVCLYVSKYSYALPIFSTLLYSYTYSIPFRLNYPYTCSISFTVFIFIFIYFIFLCYQTGYTNGLLRYTDSLNQLLCKCGSRPLQLPHCLCLYIYIYIPLLIVLNVGTVPHAVCELYPLNWYILIIIL